MILVKEAQGVTIELGTGPTGRFDTLSLRLAGGLASQPLVFHVKEGQEGRLHVHPAEARSLSELVLALGVLLANEGNILAELRKYAGYAHS